MQLRQQRAFGCLVNQLVVSATFFAVAEAYLKPSPCRTYQGHGVTIMMAAVALKHSCGFQAPLEGVALSSSSWLLAFDSHLNQPTAGAACPSRLIGWCRVVSVGITSAGYVWFPEDMASLTSILEISYCWKRTVLSIDMQVRVSEDDEACASLQLRSTLVLEAFPHCHEYHWTSW